MRRRFISSSSIRSVGYDPETQTLEIEYTSGGVYRYLDVPEFLYAALLRAPSPGTFVNTRIKPNYRFVDA